jgi:hypothetical protein
MCANSTGRTRAFLLASNAVVSQEVADGKISIQAACAQNTRYFTFSKFLMRCMGLMKWYQFLSVWCKVTSHVNKRKTRTEGPTTSAPCPPCLLARTRAGIAHLENHFSKVFVRQKIRTPIANDEEIIHRGVKQVLLYVPQCALQFVLRIQILKL